MKAISVQDAQALLPKLVNGLTEGPVLLLHKGQPCAALVRLDENFDPEAFALGQNKKLRRLINEACRRSKNTGAIAFSDIVAEVERRRPARKTRPIR